MAVRISRRSISLGLAASAALPLSGLKTHAVETDDYHVAPAGTAPFSVEVYQERRLRLMEQLKGGVAVIFGADSLANGRQNPDFAYLTGLGVRLLCWHPVSERIESFCFFPHVTRR